MLKKNFFIDHLENSVIRVQSPEVYSEQEKTNVIIASAACTVKAVCESLL